MSLNVTWEPDGLFDSTLDFLPIAGGTLTGPLRITPNGSRAATRAAGVALTVDGSLSFADSGSADTTFARNAAGSITLNDNTGSLGLGQMWLGAPGGSWGQINFLDPAGGSMPTITGTAAAGGLVQISGLTVTPGHSHFAGVTVNGSVQVNGGLNATGSIITDSHLYANGNHLFMASSGAWMRYGSNGAHFDFSHGIISGGLVGLHGNGGIWMSWDGGSITHSHQIRAPRAHIDGDIHLVGRLITNNWDIGWSNNINGNCIVNGVIQAQGRLVSNAWDTGAPNSLGGAMDLAGHLAIHAGLLYLYDTSYFWQARGDLVGGSMYTSRAVVTEPPNGFHGGTFMDRRPGNPAMMGSVRTGAPGDEMQIANHLSIGHEGSGNVYYGHLIQFSDQRRKQNITPIHDGLSIVLDQRMVPMHYTLESMPYTRQVERGTVEERTLPRDDFGFAAQDVAQVLPELVERDPQGEPNGINYVGLVAILWDAVRTLNARVVELEGRAA